MKPWKVELARDFLALGSWVFYVLVLVRALIGPFRPFVDQLVIAGVVSILLGLVVQQHASYLARGVILAVFTSIFYRDLLFSVFAAAVVVGMIFSSYVLEKNMKSIFLGIVVGALGVLTGWIGT